MSKIVIVPGSVPKRSEFIAKARRITKKGMSEIVASIDQKTPLVEWELFMNNHEETAQRLRELLMVCEDGLCTLMVYELMPNEDFDNCPVEQCEITPDILRGILDKHEVERKELEDSG